MPDDLTVEGSGAGDTPKSPVSQPAIEDADKLSKLLEQKLAEALKPVLGEVRGLQSRQDKSDKAYQEFLDEYEKAKASGKNNAEAGAAAAQAIDERKRQQQREAMFDEMAKRLGLAPDSSAGSAAVGTVDTAKVVDSLGLLDPQHPETVLLKTRTFHSEAEVKAAVAEVLAGQRAKPQPSDADRAAQPANPTAPKKGTEEDYIKEMRAVPRGAAGNAKREAIKARYQKEGVDVYNIDFT